MEPKSLPSIAAVTDLKGKYVLVRGALNMPVADGMVTNQFRLLRGLPTLHFLQNAGARVILVGHISQNKATEKEESLRPVYEAFAKQLDMSFCPEVATPLAKEMTEQMTDGSILMLENLRSDPREKKNDADFARSLADLADLYVNDAFSVSHREHASLVAVTNFLPSYFGLNFINEYEELRKALTPAKPALFLLGGAKFSTKLPLVEKYIHLYDHVFIGGALANDLFKAQGHEVGTSLLSDDADPALFTQLLSYPNLLLPVDVTVMGPSGIRMAAVDAVQPNESILDAGPKTVAMLREHISAAQTVLWNGPLGSYEQGFERQTLDTASAIAEAECYSVVGGGDTVAAIESLGVAERFSFLSTAGGAMLAFLENNTLVAIDAILEQSDKA